MKQKKKQKQGAECEVTSNHPGSECLMGECERTHGSDERRVNYDGTRERSEKQTDESMENRTGTSTCGLRTTGPIKETKRNIYQESIIRTFTKS